MITTLLLMSCRISMDFRNPATGTIVLGLAACPAGPITVGITMMASFPSPKLLTFWTLPFSMGTTILLLFKFCLSRLLGLLFSSWRFKGSSKSRFILWDISRFTSARISALQLFAILLISHVKQSSSRQPSMLLGFAWWTGIGSNLLSMWAAPMATTQW